jgi:sigma-B regulation protein RsbU (phosphoserine phosphatase)
MRRLIDQLLIFTQGVAGGVPVQRQTVNLGDLVRIVAREHSAGREIEIDDQLGGTASVDPERITQVLDNLVTNAVRYGTGKITVRLSRTGRDTVIAVHNGGAPIPPDKLDTLFDPYRRATNSRGGVGLGLYIVDQIARAHGGSVQVTSSAETGTTFALQLPGA